MSDASVQPNSAPIRMVMIGCGGMARHHVRRILQQQDTTRITLLCEPSPAALGLIAELFDEAGLPMPPNEPNLARVLADHASKLDAAFIITPHAFHHDQANACMEAGLDVLLEKPMVMSGDEAHSLIETRNRTRRLLVVAFNGSLSPQIRKAATMLRAGELGDILNVSATVWQNWKTITRNTWRQVPAVAGGGFLFDTGAHMLNTVADLVGEEFVEVSAWMDNRGANVDITGVAIARLASGALVTFNACGDTIKSCASDVRVLCTEGILRTGVWGERLLVQRNGQDRPRPVRTSASLGAWDQFVRVRAGEMENPSPPEVGLRMAQLWDAIRTSAYRDGAVVKVQNC